MKKLVLAGAGHAHLDTIMNIRRFVAEGCHVAVISPGDYHYYSGMGPGLLSGIYRPAETRFHVRRMTEENGGEFIRAKVIRIDTVNRRVVISGNHSLDYDILSCSMGSEVVPVSTKSSNIISVKPIENLQAAGQEISERFKKGRLQTVVIGGGAAGVELAGNLSLLAKKQCGTLDITLISQSGILARYKPGVRRLALSSLARRRICVLENTQVSEVSSSEVILGNGNRLPCDFVFNASGIRPVQVFRDSGLPVSEDGGLLVNEYLQCVSSPQVFGGGDCISFLPQKLDRVGVYAVRQSPVLYQNIAAMLTGRKMSAFRPQKHYLSILNMGDGRGIFAWRSFVFSGRLAFDLKDFIDRRFMKRFQVSGETEDL